jgi:hypothetical protein
VRPRRVDTSFDTGVYAGILSSVATARKITVEIPDDLLRRAQKSTGEGVTATVRRGLELVAASRTYDELRRLRGKISLSIDLAKLREDRR